MGIDIYARWRGQNEAERMAQCTGFSVEHGHVGYLREAYHGEPYATRWLVPEAFEAGPEGAAIPAKLLRERLPGAVKLAKLRQWRVYGDFVAEDDPVIRSFVEFVELCEQKERESGEPVRIIASY